MDEQPSLVVTPLEGEPITMRGYISEGIEYVDPRPKRVRRTRYAPMPEGSLYVGRPTIWGNPVTVEEAGSNAQAVEWYRLWLAKAGVIGGVARRVVELLPG